MVCGKAHTNALALSGGLPEQIGSADEINTISEGSLIGILFHKLYDLNADPEFGPYYASRLLIYKDYDMGPCN